MSIEPETIAPPADPWSVLDREKHERLYAKRFETAHQAGFPVTWLWSEHKRWLNATEISMMANYGEFIESGKHGLVYLGKSSSFEPRVVHRCWAAAAWFLRNGKPGGCWHLEKLAFKLDERGRPPRMSFLAVPNFAVDPPNLVPPLHRQAAVSAIRARRAMPGAFTVLVATSWESVAELYGEEMVDDLKITYTVIGGAS